MIDRFFSAALTFCLLAAGTAAIASLMFAPRIEAPRASAVQIVQLPRVVIVGHRLAPATEVAKSDRTETAAARLQ